MLILLFLFKNVILQNHSTSMFDHLPSAFCLSHDTQSMVETAFILSIQNKSNAIYRKTEYYAANWYQELLLFYLQPIYPKHTEKLLKAKCMLL